MTRFTVVWHNRALNQVASCWLRNYLGMYSVFSAGKSVFTQQRGS